MNSAMPCEHLGEAYSLHDYFLIREQLDDEQWDRLMRARRFVDQEVLPAINEYWEAAEFPWALARRLAELGLVGDDIEGYGCPGMSPGACGLVHMELHRGDGGTGTFLGVQAGLAMKSIYLHGSEDQKQKWLPAMARLEKFGAFALTEPEHGSDSVALSTVARRSDDGSWILDGAKRWIGNGTIADVVIVWARSSEDGQVKGFLVETSSPGYSASVISRARCARAPCGRPTSRWTASGCRIPRGCPGLVPSRTPDGPWSPRGARAPGPPSATRWRPTTPR